MNSVSFDIATRLASAGFGTLASTSPWGIYIDMMPDQPTNCISVVETMGLAPVVGSEGSTNPFEQTFFQITVRGSAYAAVWTKAASIATNLTGARFNVTETGKKVVRYRGVVRQSPVHPVASGVKGVYIRTVNFLGFRQEDVSVPD